MTTNFDDIKELSAEDFQSINSQKAYNDNLAPQNPIERTWNKWHFYRSMGWYVHLYSDLYSWGCFSGIFWFVGWRSALYHTTSKYYNSGSFTAKWSCRHQIWYTLSSTFTFIFRYYWLKYPRNPKRLRELFPLKSICRMWTSMYLKA